MADEKRTEPPTEGPKKLVLKLRERLPISTSQGTYYVRYLVTGDLPTFSDYSDLAAKQQSQDLPELGKLAIKTFTCLEVKTEYLIPLSDEAFGTLTADDVKALAYGIAEVGELGALEDGPVLEALGAALFNRLQFHAKQAAESAAEIKKIMAANFGTVSDSVKASLADSLSGMAAIRESLRESPAVVALRREVETQNRLFGQVPKDLLSQIDYTKQLGIGTTADGEFRRHKADETRLAGLIPKAALEQLEHQDESARINARTSNLPIFQPPPVAETPIGRAAIAGEESARQLREVAGLAGQMTDKIANLSEVMLTRVFPEWFKNLDDGSKATNRSLVQAEKSVNLAKQAILWSIGITVAMTLLQLWVARNYKLENDVQQTTSENLMRKQLEAIEAQNKQLADDSRKLNEQLARVSQSLSNLPSTKGATATMSVPATAPGKGAQ
jgi:hypothetical protein